MIEVLVTQIYYAIFMHGDEGLILIAFYASDRKTFNILPVSVIFYRAQSFFYSRREIFRDQGKPMLVGGHTRDHEVFCAKRLQFTDGCSIIRAYVSRRCSPTSPSVPKRRSQPSQKDRSEKNGRMQYRNMNLTVGTLRVV